MEKRATTTMEIVRGQRAQSHSDGYSRTNWKGRAAAGCLARRGGNECLERRERKRTAARNHGLPERTPEEKKEDRNRTEARQTDRHTHINEKQPPLE